MTVGDEAWQRFEIRRIEDLGNAVLGAGLAAVQMTGPPVRGSLAFAARDGVVFSSGRIEGNVLLTGPLAADAVTVGLIVRSSPRTRLGNAEARDGTVALVGPGECVDAYIGADTLYLAATLAPGRLRAPVVGAQCLPAMPPDIVDELHDGILALHDRDAPAWPGPIGQAMLAAVLPHLALAPAAAAARETGATRIVAAALDYIADNLASPITTEALAAAAATPRRTLYRAFADVLGDTPQGHVRRLRLHCIRRRLLAPDQPACTVVAAARSLGLDHDMGRLSQRYRALFGEPPSATLARRHSAVEAAQLM